MSQLIVQPLLNTATATINDVVCSGECRHKSAEECASTTHLVFPYRGVYRPMRGAVVTRLVVFPQESHQLAEPKNFIQWQGEALTWVRRWLTQ